MTPILGTTSSLGARGYGFLGRLETITITSQPTSTSANQGSTATFSISATVTGTGSLNYQWQRSDDSGSTWNNVGSNSNTYTTPSLSVANDNNDKYRCIVSSDAAIDVTSNEVTLTVVLIDFIISPAINGKTSWSLAADGALIFDSSSATTYTIVAQRTISQTVKMWGEGRSGGTGGYSTGTISFNSGSTYTVKLNYGGGNAGTGYGSRVSSAQPGGGLAGMFFGTSIGQGSAMMIAGGAGGGGDGTNGGGGGGPSGSNGQNSPNTEISSTGGSGGTSGAGGGAGSPTDTNVYYRLGSSQNVTFTVTEDSGYFNRLNIQGVKNFPEDNSPNPETRFVNAGTYLVTASNDTTGFSAVRVDPGNPQRVQANDGGGSWDDIQVTVSAGAFTSNVPATPGSALQGGTGGRGVITEYANAAGGGGGGGGWYGGGGGGGGNDFGNVTRSSSGGGGGSGYINGSYVTSGSTGSYQDSPNRGSAGQSNGPSRVVIE